MPRRVYRASSHVSTLILNPSTHNQQSKFVQQGKVKMSEPEIPKQCKAGVVVNEGPDFRVEVQMVDVPEPSKSSS